MLNSYVLTLYRSLTRHRLFSALNIFGLAVGMAVFLALTIAARFEFSYDRWIPGNDRVYRLSGEMRIPGRPQEIIALAPGPVLPNLRADFPQIEAGVRVLTRDFAVRRGAQGDYETISFADGEFFEVFDLPMVAGDGGRALQGTSNLVLSEAMARKYFGDQPALGQRLSLTLDGVVRDYTVSAVLKELPDNTHLKIGFLALLDQSVLPNSAEYLDVWNATNYATYVKLPNAASADALAESLPAFMQRRAESDVAEWFGLKLEPLTDLHFNAKQMGEFKPGIDKRFVYMLQIVGALTLALAMINYINLATARAVLRAREVGLRKVFGATRGALIFQFLVEALIVSLISGVIAVAIVELTLPLINSALGTNLDLSYFGPDGVVWLLLAVVVVVALGAGLYPAFVISRFEPAAVLASAKSPGGGKGAALIREILVVIQFAVSVTLLICTGVVVAQADFVRKADLGFQREGLILIEQLGAPGVSERRTAILDGMRRAPGVVSASLSGRAPGWGGTGRSTSFTRSGLQGQPPSLAWETSMPDYFKTLGIAMAAGRPLDPVNRLDDRAGLDDAALTARGLNVVINETAAKALEFAKPEDAVNQLLQRGPVSLRIVGVARDARFGSPREVVPPIVYFLQTAPQGEIGGNETIIVRYQGDPDSVMEGLQAAWRQVEPAAPFEGKRVEEAMSPFYEPDEQRNQLITMGAIVACLIGCLGLYGLAAFNSERRTKEIGIRKVLGASTRDVYRVLVGQFLRPVIIANLIAWPTAYVLAREWLQGFDQHVALSPVYFILATAVALAVALATVSGQAFRVARRDPGVALRYE